MDLEHDNALIDDLVNMDDNGQGDVVRPGDDGGLDILVDDGEGAGKVGGMGGDPWAHRRGEPRVFAFVWMVYLLLATLGTFASAGAFGGFTIDTYRPAVQKLMLLLVVGVCVVWPMIRLSQRAPERVGLSVLKDYVILVGPMQAVIWPQILLASWPVSITGAISLWIAGWGLVTAALLAMGLKKSGRGGMGWWMAAHVALIGIGVIGLVVVGGNLSDDLGWGWMMSPISGVFDISLERQTMPGGMGTLGRHWIAAGIIWAIGLGAWLLMQPGGHGTEYTTD